MTARWQRILGELATEANGKEKRLTHNRTFGRQGGALRVRADWAKMRGRGAEAVSELILLYLVEVGYARWMPTSASHLFGLLPRTWSAAATASHGVTAVGE